MLNIFGLICGIYGFIRGYQTKPNVFFALFVGMTFFVLWMPLAIIHICDKIVAGFKKQETEN